MTYRSDQAALRDWLVARGVSAAAAAAADYAERAVRIERIERELDDGLDGTTLGIMYALDEYDGLAAARCFRPVVGDRRSRLSSTRLPRHANLPGPQGLTAHRPDSKGPAVSVAQGPRARALLGLTDR